MPITASKLKSGVVIQWNGGLFKVLETEFRGTGKSGKMIQAKMHDLAKDSNVDHRFDADEKLENIDLDKQDLQFLYSDEGVYYFMDPKSCEQVFVNESLLGNAAPYLKPESMIQVELFNEKIVNVVLPEFMEVKVVTAPPAIRESGSVTLKEVTLENGVALLVPQFIREGDTIRVDWANKKYVDRVKDEKN